MTTGAIHLASDSFIALAGWAAISSMAKARRHSRASDRQGQCAAVEPAVARSGHANQAVALTAAMRLRLDAAQLDLIEEASAAG